MKSMMKAVVDNVTFRLVVCGLMFLAAGAMIVGAFGALMVYVHPMAALVFLGVLVCVLGYFYDK